MVVVEKVRAVEIIALMTGYTHFTFIVFFVHKIVLNTSIYSLRENIIKHIFSLLLVACVPIGNKNYFEKSGGNSTKQEVILCSKQVIRLLRFYLA